MVGVSGEVKFPGIYTVKKGEKLSSLIERAGGYTDRAYLRGAVFTRERVRQLQQKQIDEMTERLERELLGKGAAEVGVALSSEDTKIKESEIKQKRDFVAMLKGIKAKGRMVLKIDRPETLKNTPYDIELEEGDSLFIMANPQSVQVIGSVYNQTAFVYDKAKGVSRYIDLAGGFTENADKKRVYLLKADGTAVRPGSGFLGISWSKTSNRWESGGSNIESGDTIVVPEKLEKVAWMRNIKDITQILFQIATTAGVLIVAF
jgi:protein involved in polysaccharide export with SLBB domain